MHIGLCSSLTHHFTEVPRSTSCYYRYFVDRETEAHPGLLGYWLQVIKVVNREAKLCILGS